MSNKPISRKKNIVDGKGTVKTRGEGLNRSTPSGKKESGNILKGILNRILHNEGKKDD